MASTSHTVAESQQALNALSFGPIDVDGAAGPQTDAAITKFQTAKKIPVTGKFDDATLAALFPSRTLDTQPRTIQATAFDWFLNFAQSKTNYAAGIAAVALITFVNTHWGLNLPDSAVAGLTTVLAAAGMGAIWLLQTFLNSPHVTTKQPAVVQQPGIFK